jgi:hypothetical protein
MPESKNDFINNLTSNWQIITFVVVLLGYMTLSFYLNINGFSFIEIDIKHIIGLGLLVSIFVLWILLMSIKIDSLFILIINALIPVFIINLLNAIDSIIFITSIIGATIFTTFIFLDIDREDYKNKIEHKIEKNKVQSLYDKLFMVLLIPVILTLEINYALLFITNLIFLWSFQKFYLFREYFNPFQLLSFLIIIPFILALIINSNGFKISNFDKKNISLVANDKKISGILIYQNTNSFFILDKNNSIEVQKDEISSNIEYTNYIYEKQTLNNIILKYLSTKNLEHNTAEE